VLLQETDFDNLCLQSNGWLPAESVVLLTSPPFFRLLEPPRQHRDMNIINSLPILPPDTKVLEHSSKGRYWWRT
jgi:hypothetical protein